MTTYEFEVAAKNAVIDFAKNNLYKEVTFNQIDVVWMAHVLGYKKCTLYSPVLEYYFEITYNRDENVIYLDVYAKTFHKIINRLETKIKEV